ncbi:MAG: DUF58 domain-containing protein, partial [Spirochaetaceae bacterium]|nr:DUF58 domain-containing protein [Spirochaetaceae bacterium]
PCPVPAAYRGAYYGAQDEIVFFDFFGFWRASIPLPQGEAPRLCVCPVCLPELRQPDFAAGGSGERRGQSAVKPEEFYDNRPYVPGDDPRRLNWKLYGHSGELFVREALRQTPPNACLTIIVDTETDPGLLNGEAALHAVDVLCSAALTFAALSAERGCAVRLLRTDAHTNNVNMGAFAACLRQSANRAIRSNLAASQPNSASIPCAAQGATRLADSQRPPCRESTIGYESDALPAGERGNGTFELNPKPKKGPCPPTAGGDGVLPTDAGYDGSETLEGEAAETAWIEQELSFPAAIPLGTGDSLGKTAGGGDVFYLALPRCPGEAENPPSALDKFLAGSSRRADGTAAKNIKIIFIYPKNIHNGAAKKIEYAAYSNALWYGAKGAAGAESIGT